MRPQKGNVGISRVASRAPAKSKKAPSGGMGTGANGNGKVRNGRVVSSAAGTPASGRKPAPPPQQSYQQGRNYSRKKY